MFNHNNLLIQDNNLKDVTKNEIVKDVKERKKNKWN